MMCWVSVGYQQLFSNYIEKSAIISLLDDHLLIASKLALKSNDNDI